MVEDEYGSRDYFFTCGHGVGSTGSSKAVGKSFPCYACQIEKAQALEAASRV